MYALMWLVGVSKTASMAVRLQMLDFQSVELTLWIIYSKKQNVISSLLEEVVLHSVRSRG